MRENQRPCLLHTGSDVSQKHRVYILYGIITLSSHLFFASNCINVSIHRFAALLVPIACMKSKAHNRLGGRYAIET